MKRILIVGILALALVMAMGGVAYANFGTHGGYAADTDACAGCHRAHTAFSTIPRTNYLTGDAAGEGSALLVSSATNMTDFCYACHGEGAPGASTNVEYGIFDSGPSAGYDTDGVTLITGGVTQLYSTESSFGATLNGGGFERIGAVTNVTSTHTMSLTNNVPIWGAGSAASDEIAVLSDFNCGSCHDPHGSSNYRLLKDKLLGTNVVGGYVSDLVPEPFVISAEVGYPAGGFAKHTAYPNYKPDYTTPQYRFSGDSLESMSGWCAGCHEDYNQASSAYDYEGYEEALTGTTLLGSRTRHRHPVNMNLLTGRESSGNMSLATEVALDDALPLELAYSKNPNVYRDTKDFDDVLGCLTCHFAHGSSVTETGWADSSLETSSGLIGSTTATWYPVLDDGMSGGSDPASDGVNPNFSSALLRTPNRGVCERCHNK